MKTAVFFLISLILCVTLGVSGCISAVKPIGDQNKENTLSPLQVYFISQDGDWSPSRGCYWDISYQVYNAGDIPLKNVRLTIELINANSGAVRDSRDIAIGAMAPGTAQEITGELDGECTNEYTVRAVPSFDR